jgi:pyruvate/2-oxoglutarate dehydrogenase complex dihydrolipoamide acyltransferase (E2) component
VAEITTEKASYDIEAPASGVLHPVAKEGDPLAIEGLIGYVLEEGEAPPPEPDRGPVARPDSAMSVEATWRVPAGGLASAEESDEPVPVQGLPSPAATPTAAYARLKASPAARRLAVERGVELAAIVGSGPAGRIVEADVLAAAVRRPAAAAPATVPWRIARRIPLAGVRGAVARRLRRSLATTVPLTLTREARAEALVAARERLRARLGFAPWDAIFVKLFADALRERPALNAIVAGDEVLVLDEVHVGFAVPVEAGLLVPVVRDADRRPFAAVAAAVRELGERARAGKVSPSDLLGGTATVSNLGVHGIDAFTPVLNPPQSALLGVGRVAPRPVVDDGRVVAGETCVLSLTFDHRVADGAPAAELLAAVVARMSDASYLAALGAEAAAG